MTEKEMKTMEEELGAATAEAEGTASAETTAKAAKPKKPRKISVTFTADKDIKAGETITFDYELPASTGTRGVNSGIPVEQMTAEQLKIEYRNANSVLYKTKKAGRDATKAQARLDAVVAAMQNLGITPGAGRAKAPAKVDASTIANLITTGQVSIDDIQKLLDSANNADTTPAAE